MNVLWVRQFVVCGYTYGMCVCVHACVLACVRASVHMCV